MAILNLIVALFWLGVIYIWLTLIVGNHQRWRARAVVDPVEGFVILLNLLQLVLVAVVLSWQIYDGSWEGWGWV